MYLLLITGRHGEELRLLGSVGRRVCDWTYSADCLSASVNRQFALSVCVLTGGSWPWDISLIR